MPIYDLICAEGHETLNQWLKSGEKPACPTCGGATAYLWSKGTPVMIPDTYATPVRDPHLAAGRVYVHESRSQHRDRMRAHGVVRDEQHGKGILTDRGRWT